MKIIIAILIAFPGLSMGETVIPLGVGFSSKISVGPGQKILLDNGSLVTLKDLGHHLLITGKKVGITRLSLGDRSMEIRVADKTGYLNFLTLSKTIGNMEGINLVLQPDVPVVVGELLSLNDWRELASEFRALEGKYRFQAHLFPPLIPQVRKLLLDLAIERQLAPPKISLKDKIEIWIPAGNSKSKSHYESVYGPYGLEVNEDTNLVAIEPLIEVEILVAEVRQNGFKRLGIQWPTTYSTQIMSGVSNGLGEKGGLPGSISLLVHALEEKGMGRLLASPKLLCRSGKEARFLAGGEFPIKIVNFKVNDVIWKKYGILLAIKPVADRTGHMSIAIETEVSTIDPSRTVDGVPGLLTNRIESHFDLEKSKTVSLSGLIKQENSEARSGLAGLSSLPILGALFSSRDFIENRTELVFFVTPRIVLETEIATPKLPEGFGD